MLYTKRSRQMSAAKFMAKNMLEIHKSLEQSPLKEAPRTAMVTAHRPVYDNTQTATKGGTQPKAKKKETYRYLRTSVAQG